MLVVDLCGKLIDRCIVADIGLVDRGTGTGIPDGRSGFLCCGEIAVDDHDGAGTLAGQLDGGGAADPGTRPGDQSEFAPHVTRPGSHSACTWRSGTADDSVDPFAGQPRDDVRTRGHHPVAALDRNDPAAQRD